MIFFATVCWFVQDSALLLNLYYVALVGTVYVLMMRGALVQVVLVLLTTVGTTLAQTYFTVAPTLQDPLLDQVLNFTAWCVLMLLFWALGRAGYRHCVEARRREVQQQFHKMRLDARATALTCAAHELRTPVAGILGSAEILIDEVLDQLPGTGREFVVHIHESSRYLGALLKDILDYADAEAGRITLSPESVDLPSFLRECVALVEVRAKKVGVAVEVFVDDSADSIEADPRKLKQIIINMLSNAVQSTPAGQTVELRVDARKEDVLISVRDSGDGIPVDDIPRLFEPFYQEPRDVHSVGSGLGLAVARQLVELHGGTITVKSEPGQGAQFTIRMPRQPRPPSWHVGREGEAWQAGLVDAPMEPQEEIPASA
jgi:signal transduction histidine kinase